MREPLVKFNSFLSKVIALLSFPPFCLSVSLSLSLFFTSLSHSISPQVRPTIYLLEHTGPCHTLFNIETVESSFRFVEHDRRRNTSSFTTTSVTKISCLPCIACLATARAQILYSRWIDEFLLSFVAPVVLAATNTFTDSSGFPRDAFHFFWSHSRIIFDTSRDVARSILRTRRQPSYVTYTWSIIKEPCQSKSSSNLILHSCSITVVGTNGNSS